MDGLIGAKISQNIKSLAPIVFFTAAIVFVLNAAAKTVCEEPLKYSLGTIDPRFGLDEEEFMNMIQRAEHAWEDAVNLELFIYDEGTPFKINLIYDDRQKRTDEAKDL